MARRYDHSREDLQEMAIQAGRSIIQSQGFGKFSARQVAAEIGYTVGTVYNLFGSHDNLILHINARTLDTWFEDLQHTFAARKRPPSFEGLALYYIDYSAAHYNEWMALFEHSLPPDTPMPEWYIPKMRRFFELLEGMVLPYVKNNRRKARRAARVLWAGIHGICMLSLSRKLDLIDSESAKTLAKSFVENYLRGLQHA
ncbi:MAG: TetR/AcrR family transcriptional regulator [Pseudomonadota bacterium]